MPACPNGRSSARASRRTGTIHAGTIQGGGAVAHRRVRSAVARLAIAALAAAPAACVIPLDPQASQPKSSNSDFTPETGPYLGGSVIYNEVEGDFDGNKSLVSSGGNVTIDLPSVDPGLGGRMSGGYRWSQAKVELAAEYSSHDDSFQGVDHSATYWSYDMNGYYYLPSPWERVKPNVMGGFALPTIELHHSSTSGAFTGDGHLYGYGFNLGGGADIYVTRNLSIDVLGFYHWTRFTTAAGVGTGYHTIHGGDIDGDGWTLSVGAAWTF
jgi:hypothetical protein